MKQNCHSYLASLLFLRTLGYKPGCSVYAVCFSGSFLSGTKDNFLIFIYEPAVKKTAARHVNLGIKLTNQREPREAGLFEG